MNFPIFPKVPIDRVHIVNGAEWQSAIPALRKMYFGTLPRHGAPDGPIPPMTATAIVAKQIVHFLSYTGRWPK